MLSRDCFGLSRLAADLLGRQGEITWPPGATAWQVAGNAYVEGVSPEPRRLSLRQRRQSNLGGISTGRGSSGTVGKGISEAARAMITKSTPAALSASILPPMIAGLLAIAVFIVDTITPLDIAVAVLYVVVVLMAANYFNLRGVLLVSMGCLVLTVLSFLISHGFRANSALARCVMSVAAIGATTVLALKNQSANAALGERARLLDLTHDALLVRNAEDIITFWNRGAEELYGWSRSEAIGKVTHHLLKTV